MPPKPRPVAHLPQSFIDRKQRIIEQISVPTERYDDLSPKGSIDEGIRDLISWINGRDGWVTTSSCSGRISIFAEGRKKTASAKYIVPNVTFSVDTDGENANADAMVIAREQLEKIEQEQIQGTEEKKRKVARTIAQDEEGRNSNVDGKVTGVKPTEAGIGGKGGGGKWIFISHDPISLETLGMEVLSFLGMKQLPAESAATWSSFEAERLIHFKFEPMILHILAASYSFAQSIVDAALQAGFRESGAINLSSDISEPAMPMVAVRSTGLALDCIIGRLSTEDEAMSFVPNGYLMGLLEVANERFAENSRRMQRFWDLLKMAEKKSETGEWEDAAVRRERKRAEGLKKSMAIRAKGE